MNFEGMNAIMPIASMIKTAKKDNDMCVTRMGATITNRKGGQVVRPHERQGVYFSEMQL